MINFLEIAKGVLSLSETLKELLKQSGKIRATIRSLREAALPPTAYENLSLEMTPDIQDASGRRAVLERRQRVRFLIEDEGVVRDLVWGDGRPMANYGRIRP